LVADLPAAKQIKFKSALDRISPILRETLPGAQDQGEARFFTLIQFVERPA